MGWGFLTLLTFFGGAGLLAFFVMKSGNMKTYIPPEDSSEHKLFITREKAEALRNIYITVYRTLNTNAVFSVMSDLFFHSVYSELLLLRKLGIRRELYFVPKPTKDNEEENFVMVSASYGSLTFTDTSDKGEYWERLVDTATDQILYERHYKHAEFYMRFNRNPNRLGSQQLYCCGCGTPLSINGEVFVCSSCGNTYHGDSYEWMMTGVEVVERDALGTSVDRDAETGKKDNSSTIANIAVGALLVMLVLSFFSGGNAVIRGLTIIVNLLMLGIYGLAAAVIVTNNGPYKKLVEFDGNCHPERVADRANFLVKKMLLAREIDPSQIKPFMDEVCYNQWRGNLVNTDEHVLFSKPAFIAGSIRKFWTDNQRQYVLVQAAVSLTTLTPDRQVKLKDDFVAMILYRNLATRYQNARSAEIFTCQGCGMSINMTADAKCKFCGTGYDVADYDWKIYQFTSPHIGLVSKIEKVVSLFTKKKQ